MRDRRKILQITSYPPPRAGWGVRVQFLKRRLEADGHECVVLNIGTSRRIPSDEYETVLGAWDYARKVWRYSRAGFVAHVHVNGQSPKGFLLAIAAQLINLACGRRSVLTFHAGLDQAYFPRPRAPLLLPVFWILFAVPKRIICNSEAVKRKIVEYGVPAEKVVPIAAFSHQYLEFDRVSLGEPLETFYLQFPEILFCYINLRAGFNADVLLDGFARLAQRRGDVGLMICGLSGHREGPVAQDFSERIARYGLDSRIKTVGDLDRHHFLTALCRSAIYVRTPTSDGVSSSVLEALCLGVPVVAAENGTRPPSVITYLATDPVDLADTLDRVLSSHAEIVTTLHRPVVPDTLADEARLLTA
jgi:glycosyltransferase involved in cell wall biosynthesis